MAAYHRGDFQKSLSLFKPLAEKGDARAQYMVGRHHQFGQAVKADRAAAYYWYGRAERGGYAEAKLFKHLLASGGGLTAAERAAADKRLAALKGGPRPVVEMAARPAPPAAPAAATPPRGAIAALPDAKPDFGPPPPRPEATVRREAVAVAPPPPKPSVQPVQPPAPRPAPARTDPDDDTAPNQPALAPAPRYTAPARTYAAAPPENPPDSATDYANSDYWRGQPPRATAPPQPQPRYYAPNYPTAPTYTPPAYAPRPYYGAPYPRYAPPAYSYGYRQPYYTAPRPYYAPQPYAAPRIGVYADFRRGVYGFGVWNGRRW